MRALDVVYAVAVQEVVGSGRLPTAGEIAEATRLSRRTVTDHLSWLVSEGRFELAPGGGWRLPTVPRRDGVRVGRVVLPLRGSPARQSAVRAVVAPGEIVPGVEGESLAEHQIRAVESLLAGVR